MILLQEVFSSGDDTIRNGFMKK